MTETVSSIPTCTWTQDDWGGDSSWETQCGHVFEFTYDGPLENDMTFCGYCGARLVEEYTSTAHVLAGDD